MAYRSATALLLFAASSLGCSDIGARVYSVIVTESDNMECDVVNSTHPDPDELDRIAQSTESAWEEEHMINPSLPQGAKLRVVKTEHDIFVWFEQFSVTGLYGLKEGSQDQVLIGTPEPNYIQAIYEQVIHPEDSQSSNVLGLCRDLMVFRETVELTRTDSEVEGRLHIVENQYLAAGISECAGLVTCRRNLPINGAADLGQ